MEMQDISKLTVGFNVKEAKLVCSLFQDNLTNTHTHTNFMTFPTGKNTSFIFVFLFLFCV